ncbi:Protein SWSN-4, partial [Aphelenchoides avenae]
MDPQQQAAYPPPQQAPPPQLEPNYAAPPQPAGSAIPNQEVYIAKIHNTLEGMADQRLQADDRYAKLSALEDHLKGGARVDGQDGSDKPTEDASDGPPMTPEQLERLRAQVSAYKMLARNEPVPRSLLNKVMDRKVDSILPLAYEFPVELDGGEKLPYDLSKVLNIHQQ